MANIMTTTFEKLAIGLTKAKGRGVFASADFVEGQMIESSPVIVIPASHRAALDTTALFDYYFSWGPDLTEAAICLGFGSLYNHSYSPNARYVKDYDNGKINFIAVRVITAGEEITVNYNGDPSNSKPIWFEPVSEEP